MLLASILGLSEENGLERLFLAYLSTIFLIHNDGNRVALRKLRFQPLY
jgi:hypothetical protein